jgi:uncharacterized membrane protein YkvA (DUF1232 family)
VKLIVLFRTAWQALPRLLPLLRHPGVPFWLKAGTVAGALFVVSPLDLLGDIPVLGLFDDATLLALLTSLFVVLAEAALQRRARARASEPRIVRPVALHD